MRGIVLLNTAFFAALFASVLFIEGFVDWMTLIFQGCLCLWITVWGAHRCLESPDLRSLIAALDLSVMLLLLYTALLSGAGLPILWCAPAAAGCAASILGLIARRSGRPLGPKEWGTLLLFFSGLSAVMWLLVVLAAAPAGQGLVALWNTFAAFVRWLAQKLWSVFLFLMSLFPNVDPGKTALGDPAPALSAEEMVTAEATPVISAILIAVLTAATVSALVLVLRRLGKLRAGGAQSSITGPQRTGRISLRQALKRIWTALTHRRKPGRGKGNS